MDLAGKVFAVTGGTDGPGLPKPKHQRTRDIQKSLETRVRAPLVHFDSRKYIQHNVNLGDGLAPILELMDSLPADRTRVKPLRSFEDGDFSIAHLDYELGDWGPMVGFEIHRWKDERIVEHWDNLQSTPPAPNPNGRTMTDGETEVSDLDRTVSNKKLVSDFMKAIAREPTGRSDVGRARALLSPALIQHNPTIGDGAEPFLALLEAERRYRQVHMVLGQGNMVLAVSEGGSIGDGAEHHAAFYDLFRLAGDRIAEHWDVVEHIPPRATWKNDNGKF